MYFTVLCLKLFSECHRSKAVTFHVAALSRFSENAVYLKLVQCCLLCCLFGQPLICLERYGPILRTGGYNIVRQGRRQNSSLAPRGNSVGLSNGQRNDFQAPKSAEKPWAKTKKQPARPARTRGADRLAHKRIGGFPWVFGNIRSRNGQRRNVSNICFHATEPGSRHTSAAFATDGGGSY